MSGKEVHVNPLAVFYDNLQRMYESLLKSGRKPMVIKAADKNRSEDDLIDYLMLAAEGYQESRLHQSERSPGGAVGIMQVLLQYATAAPIIVPNLTEADGNIHAGAKMLRTKAEQCFNDPGVDSLNSYPDALRQLLRGPEPHRSLARPSERTRPQPQRLVR